jgi:hypothetical protein
MKKLSFTLLVFFLITTAFAGAFIDFISARSEGDNVKVEWKTGEEKDIQEFVIERRSVNGYFSQLATIQPKGSNSYYYYRDENAYKSNDFVFVYRLKIVDSDNSFSYSKEITVSHSVSGVKRTWGSIKAMFR